MSGREHFEELVKQSSYPRVPQARDAERALKEQD